MRVNDIIARLGGDEFFVLMQEISGKEALEAIALELIDIINQSVDYQGQACRVGASIGGISFKVGIGFKISDLINQADAAMYEAKEMGKNGCRVKQLAP